jgi:protein-disulfide isomerase
MKRISTLAAALLISGTLAASACAQAPGAQTGGATISPDSVTARADRGRMKGADSAKATIVEVSDFQCPYCRQFASGTYAQIDSAYVRTGRARLVYINLPLSIHANAFSAAEAAMCAGAQGKFWQMHDRLFATQAEWGPRTDAGQRFERMAQALSLDMAAYRECTANDRTASIILNDAMQAGGAGIQGTPAFILNGPGGQRALSGAVSFEQFASEMNIVLAAPQAEAPPRP